MKHIDKIQEIAKLMSSDLADENTVIESLNLLKKSEEEINILYEETINPIDLELMEEIAENQEDRELIPCGIDALDEAMSGGIATGSSVVLAAPSGQGKTQFMVTMSYHFMKQDIPCLWFSFEENVKDIWKRFQETGLKKGPVYHPVDLSDNKINYIERAIKKFKKEHKFFVVFIDQLSFLAPKVGNSQEIDKIQGNYSMYLGLIANQIKEIAMEHQIIIIFAHQLGRSGDVAYSDMIKHSPDKVIYLEREPATDGGSEEFTDKTKITFKKNRPYGNRPIIPMTVEKGLFREHEGMIGEETRKIMREEKAKIQTQDDNLFNEE